MLARPLVAALMVAALAIAGCGGGDDNGSTRQIAGDWTGVLKQSGLQRFRIAVRIERNGTGRVAYTGIECGGDWTHGGIRASTPPRFGFNENVEEGAGGNCKGSGTVSLTPGVDHAPEMRDYGSLRYRFRGGGVTSAGFLHRTSPRYLRAVFERVEVTPP